MLHFNTRKLCPPVELCHIIHFDELPRQNVGGANVPDLSRDDEIMKCAHGLFKRRIDVEHVNHEDIDVIRAKSLQAGLNLVEYGRAGEATMIYVVASASEFGTRITCFRRHYLMVHEIPDFRHNNKIIPWDVVL